MNRATTDINLCFLYFFTVNFTYLDGQFYMFLWRNKKYGLLILEPTDFIYNFLRRQLLLPNSAK